MDTDVRGEIIEICAVLKKLMALTMTSVGETERGQEYPKLQMRLDKVVARLR